MRWKKMGDMGDMGAKQSSGYSTEPKGQIAVVINRDRRGSGGKLWCGVQWRETAAGL